MRTLSWVAARPPSDGEGLVVLLLDKENPVGFGGAYSNAPPFSEEKWLHIFCAYSKTRNTKDTQMLVDYGKKYAKTYGYHKVTACSVRLNGVGKRFYHEKLGFNLGCVNFFMDVNND